MVQAPSREPINTTGAGPRIMRLGDLVDDWERYATELHEARVEGRARGPVTGFEKLDRELGGALVPGVHIGHGNTGAGKTALALQIAATAGCPCLFVTTEMATLELLARHTARVTETYLGRLKSGELPPAASRQLVQRAVAAAPALTLVDATLEYIDPVTLRTVASGTRGEARHLLIILDSLHTWADMAPVDVDEYTRLNLALAALRRLAADLGCVVFATCERNRGAIRSGGLNAGADSRKIEYACETLWDLERDLDAREDAAGEVPVTVKLAKNRHGAAGRQIELRFHGALQRFRAA
jgi:replicative DNA helicase